MLLSGLRGMIRGREVRRGLGRRGGCGPLRLGSLVRRLGGRSRLGL